MSDLFFAIFNLGTAINWYESRIEMGHPYYAELAQLRILRRYMKVLRYLQIREERKQLVAA